MSLLIGWEFNSRNHKVHLVIRKFVLAVAAAFALVSPSKADITAIAATIPVPWVAVPTWSPELTFNYSRDAETPQYVMVTMEILDVGTNTVIAGDVAVIDSFAAANSFSFGWYELPPGNYIVTFHAPCNSSAAPFSVLAEVGGGVPLK